MLSEWKGKCETTTMQDAKLIYKYHLCFYTLTVTNPKTELQTQLTRNSIRNKTGANLP